MSIFIVKAKKTALQSPLSTTATFITVRELVDSKGNALTMSHFGDWFVIAIKQGDKQEMIKCTNITQNSNGTATVTVATNGRNLDPTSPYVGYATGESFQSGEVIVTNDPLTLSVFAHLDNEQIWTETQTFEKAPIIEADGTEDNEAVRKSQLDNAVFGTPMITPVVFPGVAGETILVDKVVYLDEDGMWYLADAETVGKSENVILGISRGGGTTGNAIGGGVTVFGGHTASSAIFTANTHYYVSDTDGELSDTPGTLEVSLGVAKTTTLILLYPRYNQQLTEAIQDALQNPTSGTPLSADNGVVDEADTSTTPIANKIPRADADGSIDGWIGTLGTLGETLAEGVLVKPVNVSGSAKYTQSHGLYPSKSGGHTVGTMSTVNSTMADAIKIEKMTDELAVCMFRESSTARITFSVLKMSTAGAITAYGGYDTGLSAVASYGFADITRLTDTTFVAVWNNSNDSHYSTAVIGTVNPSTGAITFNTPARIQTDTNSNGVQNAVSRLTDTSFVYAFSGASSYVKTLVGTISGTTITPHTIVSSGTQMQLSDNAAFKDRLKVVSLSDTSFVASFVGTSSTTVNAFAGSVGVDGYTVTLGSVVSETYTPLHGISIDKVSTENAVISFGVSGAVYVLPISISGNVVTKGTVQSVSTQSGYLARVKTIKEISPDVYSMVSLFRVSTTLYIGVFHLNVATKTVTSGVYITATASVTNDEYSGADISVLQDSQNQMYGVAVGKNSADLVAYPVTFSMTSDITDCVGITQESGDEDDIITITTDRNISSAHSDLVVGTKKYLQHDGSLGDTESDVLVGVPLSETKMFLKFGA